MFLVTHDDGSAVYLGDVGNLLAVGRHDYQVEQLGRQRRLDRIGNDGLAIEHADVLAGYALAATASRDDCDPHEKISLKMVSTIWRARFLLVTTRFSRIELSMTASLGSSFSRCCLTSDAFSAVPTGFSPVSASNAMVLRHSAISSAPCGSTM